jgi:hypothetical protein
MTGDDGRVPPRPDDTKSWDDYVGRLRLLRTWSGATTDGELAGMVPALTVRGIADVLGERRLAVPDRRGAALVVRACLLLRGCSEQEIAAEQAGWHDAWDLIVTAGQDREPPRAPGRPPMLTPGAVAGVLFPVLTGVIVNIATSNTGNILAWAATAVVLAANLSLLAVPRPSRFRKPLLAGIASGAVLAVAVAVFLQPHSTGDSPLACAKADPAKYIKPPVRDPGLGVTWRAGYACENSQAPVYRETSTASTYVGTLYKAHASVFLCVAGRAGDLWYRTVADSGTIDHGWGYISQDHINAVHPVPGMPSCASPDRLP